MVYTADILRAARTAKQCRRSEVQGQSSGLAKSRANLIGRLLV